VNLRTWNHIKITRTHSVPWQLYTQIHHVGKIAKWTVCSSKPATMTHPQKSKQTNKQCDIHQTNNASCNQNWNINGTRLDCFWKCWRPGPGFSAQKDSHRQCTISHVDQHVLAQFGTNCVEIGNEHAAPKWTGGRNITRHMQQCRPTKVIYIYTCLKNVGKR